MIDCFIPARIGSQRLEKKNLEKINGKSLVRLVAEKCLRVNGFDRVVVSSDSDEILREVADLPVYRSIRPDHLSNGIATSEDFIYHHFSKNPNVSLIIMVHSIAPLLKLETIQSFLTAFKKNDLNTQLSVNDYWLEFVLDNRPVNFSYSKKENSQDLQKLSRINWAISAWERESFIDGWSKKNSCGTYSGKVGYFTIEEKEAIMIKERSDLELVRKLVNKE